MKEGDRKIGYLWQVNNSVCEFPGEAGRANVQGGMENSQKKG
jgi:hypothetical protein